MSSFKEAFGDLLQGTVNAGLKVPFSEKELEYYGVKPKKTKSSGSSIRSAVPLVAKSR